MFADQTREVVYAWKNRPIAFSLHGNVTPEAQYDFDTLRHELNEISDTELIALSSPSSAGDVRVLFSTEGHHEFIRYYRNLFKSEFGEEEFRKWDAEGAFDFPYNAANPCFGFGLYDPKEFFQGDFSKHNSPKIGLISIGNTKLRSRAEVLSCMREEMAHLALFIPDYFVENADESIFNINPIDGSSDDFTQLDRELIKFLANHEVRHLNRNDLEALYRIEME